MNDNEKPPTDPIMEDALAAGREAKLYIEGYREGEKATWLKAAEMAEEEAAEHIRLGERRPPSHPDEPDIDAEARHSHQIQGVNLYKFAARLRTAAEAAGSEPAKG